MHDLRRKEWKHKDIPCWTENQVHGSRFKTSILEESKKKNSSWTQWRRKKVHMLR